MVAKRLYPRAREAGNLPQRLHPVIARWFARAFGDFTRAQKLAIPSILDLESILLTSPTGSGKTFAGFLGIIDYLLREPADAAPGVRAVYVSPLRALAYDIRKNLELPLAAMGLDQRIRIGLRTGDTPAGERRRLLRQPPDILLTTPESLAILLSQPSQLGAADLAALSSWMSFMRWRRISAAAPDASAGRLQRLVGSRGGALCRRRSFGHDHAPRGDGGLPRRPMADRASLPRRRLSGGPSWRSSHRSSAQSVPRVGLWLPVMCGGTGPG